MLFGDRGFCKYVVTYAAPVVSSTAFKKGKEASFMVAQTLHSEGMPVLNNGLAVTCTFSEVLSFQDDVLIFNKEAGYSFLIKEVVEMLKVFIQKIGHIQ